MSLHGHPLSVELSVFSLERRFVLAARTVPIFLCVLVMRRSRHLRAVSPVGDEVSLGQVRLNYSVRDHKARRWRVFSSALRSAGEDIINNPAETSTWIRAYVVA